MLKASLIAIGGLLVSSWSLAQIPVGSEFLVSSYTTGSQSAAKLAMGSDGDFVVVWKSDGSDSDDASGSSIQGRRYASDGTALGPPFQVNTYTTNNQSGPSIAMGPGGDFVVVWTSRGSESGDASRTSVQGRRFRADGTALGSQFQISSPDPTAGDQFGAKVDLDSDGNMVVIWRREAGYRIDIFGQRYSADGTLLGPQLEIWSTPYEPGTPLDLAVAPDGGFTVIRGFERTFPNFGFDIRARRFTADGTALASEFTINQQAEGIHVGGRMAMGPDGDFVVAWQRQGDPFDSNDGYGIVTRRFSSDGDAVGDSVQVETNTVLSQLAPDIAQAPSGESVVVWATENPLIAGGPPPDHVPGIHGRLFSSAGVPQVAQFPVDLPGPETNSNIGAPNVAMADNGDFVVVWSRREEVSGWNVYGQRFCLDRDLDGSCDTDDLCVGDDATGDRDGDGICDSDDVCDAADPTNLCLKGDRFRVGIEWRDFKDGSGVGRAAAGSEDSGLFWFFDPDNWEILVKVLDGCDVNGHVWVFAAATTDVEYTLTVTDTRSGEVRAYFNALGAASPAVTDTSAFASCPD